MYLKRIKLKQKNNLFHSKGLVLEIITGHFLVQLKLSVPSQKQESLTNHQAEISPPILQRKEPDMVI